MVVVAGDLNCSREAIDSAYILDDPVRGREGGREERGREGGEEGREERRREGRSS